MVNGDVSSLKSVKVLSPRNGRQQSATAPADNSNSFSILTKEFLNRPENVTQPKGGGDGGKNPTNSRNLAPFPMLRINGIDVNGLAEMTIQMNRVRDTFMINRKYHSKLKMARVRIHKVQQLHRSGKIFHFVHN